MKKERTVNSALWAAYGDALGFMTELVDESGVKRRTGSVRISGLTKWRRKVGGIYGTTIDLPSGCYSDDTQLRLATSRAIRGDGVFDPEVYAKIELTVWPSYALGAGRGSKSAAVNAARSDVNWFSNYFASGKSKYLESGGNGAAMRIQPHVWSARSPGDESSFLLDVVKNTIITHGHVRGIMGAAFHAMCLSHAINFGIPGPGDWSALLGRLSHLVPSVIKNDESLNDFWLPVWERFVGRTFEDSWEFAIDELDSDIRIASELLGRGSEEAYREIVEKLDGLTDMHKGSGLKTAVFAAVLAWTYEQYSPKTALIAAANLLGSDTDSIATMAGALLGAVGNEFTEDVMDLEYIKEDAIRLHDIGEGKAAKTFYYPDLLTWKAPSSQSDVVFLDDDGFVVAGLGKAVPFGNEFATKSAKGVLWQWMKLDFGQSILVKRRREARVVDDNQIPIGFNDGKATSSTRSDREVVGLRTNKPVSKGTPGGRAEANNIDDLTKDAISSGFDEAVVGRNLLRVMQGQDAIEKAIAYAAILAKAKVSRMKKE